MISPESTMLPKYTFLKNLTFNGEQGADFLAAVLIEGLALVESRVC